MGAKTASAVVEQSADSSSATHKPGHHSSGRAIHVVVRQPIQQLILGRTQPYRRGAGLDLRQVQIGDAVIGRCPDGRRPQRNEGVGWATECLRLPPAMLLAAAVRRQVLFRSLRCIVDGVHLVVGRHVCLIHRRQNVFHLVKLRCFAVVPCCVLMMFSRTLMEFAQR